MFKEPKIGGSAEMQENTKPKIGDFLSAATVEEGRLQQGIFTKDNGDGTVILEDSNGKEIVCRAEGARKVPDENLSPKTLENVKNRREEENMKLKPGDFLSAATVEEGRLQQGIFTKDNGDGTVILEDSNGKEIVCRAEGARKVPDENLSPSALRNVERIREELMR